MGQSGSPIFLFNGGQSVDLAGITTVGLRQEADLTDRLANTESAFFLEKKKKPHFTCQSTENMYL